MGGYDGGVGSSSKYSSKNYSTKKEDTFEAQRIKRVLEDIASINIKQDVLWVTVANYIVALILIASVFIGMLMGGEDTGSLGGKKAAIKFYYDKVYGSEEGI